MACSPYLFLFDDRISVSHLNTVTAFDSDALGRLCYQPDKLRYFIG
jgi:hypothetical protein